MEELKDIDLAYFAVKDVENKLCADCGNSLPTFCSINHGILICKICAPLHLKLGFNISYIRSISDEWDQYLMGYMNRGGNNRFKRFCYKYKLFGIPIEEKYIKRSMEYYRLLIRSEVLAEEPPEEIKKEFADQKCDLSIVYFPEFENYSIYKGEIPGKENSNGIGKKIYNGGVGTFNVLKNTGGFIYSTTKPVVSFLGGATMKGLSYAYHYMTDNKYNTPKCEEKNNNDDNKKINDNKNFENVKNMSDVFGDFEGIQYNNNKNNNNINNNNNVNMNNNLNNNYNNIINNDFYNAENNNNNIFTFNNQNQDIINNEPKQNIMTNSNLDNNIPNYPIFTQENIIQGNYNYGNYIQPDITTNECIQMEENNNFTGDCGLNIAKEEPIEQINEYGNTDKEKARKDANSYLLKH